MIYFLVLANILFAAFAQILLKKGAQIKHKSFLGEYLNLYVISGYCIIGLAMIVSIYAMGQGVKLKELSIMETLSYLFVPILSFLLLKERTSKRQRISIIIIISGIIVFFS